MLRLPALLLTAVAFAGCNDDGDEDRPRVNHAVTDAKVRELAASPSFGKQRREAVFEVLGATPLSSRKALSNPDPKHPNRKRIRFVCYRFNIKGGRRGNFAELCFKNDRTLSSVVTNTPGAPTQTAPLP